MKVRLNTLIRDLPGDVYHAVPGTYSSSQLKDMIEDEELFFKKYIEKSIPRTSSSAFDVGTYFHTGVLEPEKLEDECVVFKGAVRRGAEYDAFKARHEGKCIVSQKEKAVADTLIHAVSASPVACNLLKTCSPEVSLFVKIYVLDGRDIFAKARGRMFWLTEDGWGSITPVDLTNATPLLIKVRADAIDVDGKFILDLKSTTGNAKNERTIRNKISAFKYDLSAALYLDVFSLAFEQHVKTFYWTFASKDYQNSRTWAASTDNIRIGRAKWAKAVRMLAASIRCDWKFIDCLGLAEPEYYERDWLTSFTKGE